MGLGWAKLQDSQGIKEMQMYMRSRDYSKDDVPVIWLATEGGSQNRDGCYSSSDEEVWAEEAFWGGCAG